MKKVMSTVIKRDFHPDSADTFDIEDRSHVPDIAEIKAYIGNEAFDALHRHMNDVHGAICMIEYSGDKILPGWNIKYKKSGRTLCTVYPRAGHFPVLLVVGQKEKQRVENLLPAFSSEFCGVYRNTREGMGQRWLLFDVAECSQLYYDILKVVSIRRKIG